MAPNAIATLSARSGDLRSLWADSSFGSSATLPAELTFHLLVAVNSSHNFTSGGRAICPLIPIPPEQVDFLLKHFRYLLRSRSLYCVESRSVAGNSLVPEGRTQSGMRTWLSTLARPSAGAPSRSSRTTGFCSTSHPA